MVIGGLHPCSFSDYPGKTAAVIFTQGCNFCCTFCHNGHLIPKNGIRALPVGECLDFLKRRKGLVDSVVVSGGEPTIHTDLPGFMRRVKELCFDVKLDTNGSLPEVVEQLIEEGLVDYIAMDIKAPIEKYSLLAGKKVDTDAIEKSIEIIGRSAIPHHFRTTAVHTMLSEDDMAAIRQMVPAGSRHVVQPFVPETAWNINEYAA